MVQRFIVLILLTFSANVYADFDLNFFGVSYFASKSKTNESIYFTNLYPVNTSQILTEIEQLDFEFVEKGRLDHFYSTDSCIYKSGEVILVRNYCHNNRKFPAQSYYVISPKYGYLYFYEENIGEVLKRDITLSNFPEHVEQLWSSTGTPDSIEKLNVFIEVLYRDSLPACWVTNYSRYTESPHSDCNMVEISDFPAWKQDAEDIVLDLNRWQETLELLKNSL